MTASEPRAVGVRLPYEQVPDGVRRWVEAELGAPVTAARTQPGGMSPGCAARLLLADGRRAFVKAVGAELNPDTPDLFRHEIQVLRHLDPVDYRPDVLATYDDGGWVGLLLEDVDGRHPDLTAPADIESVWRAVAEQAAELTPAPRGLQIPRLVDNVGRWGESWDAIAAEPDRCLPEWAVVEVDALRERVRSLADRLPVAALCHWDVRDDNLLVRADGSVVIVDWGMSRLGPTWGDVFALCVEWVETPQFDLRMAQTEADAATVTDLLLGVGGHGALRATQPAPPGLPTLRSFQRRAAARFLEGARRRLGLEAVWGSTTPAGSL